ncbi:hypothetical protein ACI6QG_11090 [Roseococcus sp. DSY-14]|uniref:hypothetical protein n=1 Tax=Roseococcus sp. DSY-14 TaxID=3369650 RepID=UPI00387B06D5
MPPEPAPGALTFRARAPRSAFGRGVKWAFWGFQFLMLALALGNCTMVLPYLGSADPEVALGAGLFGAQLGLGVLALWPLGTLVLGVALLLTRGRLLTLQAPPPNA